MLIHEQFVFIHMPKTAGSFISAALRRELPAESFTAAPRGRKHPGWSDIPKHARGRPALVYVRNPWDWYVSWYHAVLANWPEGWEPPLETLGDFSLAIRRACTGLIDPDGQRPAPERRQDFYTTRLRRACGGGWGSDQLVFGRFESLIDDLDRFLKQVGVPLDDAALARIRAGGRQNASEHLPYRAHYDDDLRDLVGRSCRVIVDRFGYRF